MKNKKEFCDFCGEEVNGEFRQGDSFERIEDKTGEVFCCEQCMNDHNEGLE